MTKCKFPDVVKLQDAVNRSVLKLHASVHSSKCFLFQPHEHLNSEACEVRQPYSLFHTSMALGKLLYEFGFHTWTSLHFTH